MVPRAILRILNGPSNPIYAEDLAGKSSVGDKAAIV